VLRAQFGVPRWNDPGGDDDDLTLIYSVLRALTTESASVPECRLIRIPFSLRQAGVLMRRCPQGNMGILKTPQLQLVLLVIWTLLFIEAAFPQLLNAAASEELSEKGLQIYEGSDIGARKLLQAVQRKLSDY
jgi:hypothetical protein